LDVTPEGRKLQGGHYLKIPSAISLEVGTGHCLKTAILLLRAKKSGYLCRGFSVAASEVVSAAMSAIFRSLGAKGEKGA